MAKRLKRRKSSILKNMNPDFVNKLSNIMGGAARAQDAKNKKTIGGRSNAGGKATPSKPKYPPLPPPMPLPIPKPTIKKPPKIETKVDTEVDTKVETKINMVPPKVDVKIDEPKKEIKPTTVVPTHSVVVPSSSGTHVNNNSTTNVENNTNINENYFNTIKEIVNLGYENNKYFLENSLQFIVQNRNLEKRELDTTGNITISYNQIKNMLLFVFLGVSLGYLL